MVLGFIFDFFVVLDFVWESMKSMSWMYFMVIVVMFIKSFIFLILMNLSLSYGVYFMLMLLVLSNCKMGMGWFGGLLIWGGGCDSLVVVGLVCGFCLILVFLCFVGFGCYLC